MISGISGLNYRPVAPWKARFSAATSPFKPYIMTLPLDTTHTPSLSRAEILKANQAYTAEYREFLEKFFSLYKLTSQVNSMRELGAIRAIILECTPEVSQMLAKLPDVVVSRGDVKLALHQSKTNS